MDSKISDRHQLFLLGSVDILGDHSHSGQATHNIKLSYYLSYDELTFSDQKSGW